MELYLVRHGETIYNKEGRYYGVTDVELSGHGIWQAKKLGCFFKKQHFNKVFASPLRRAISTAKELTSQEVIPDVRLMEQNFGIFEAKTYKELQSQFPSELGQWNRDWQEYVIPGGESFCMVRERAESFAEELWGEEGKILVVAHKGFFGHLAASLLHMPLCGYWNFVFEQGAYSRIDLEDGYGILRHINIRPQE